MNQMSEACDKIPIYKNQSQIETKRVRDSITAQIHPKTSIRDRFVTSFHLASDPSLFLCLYPSFDVLSKAGVVHFKHFFSHTWLTGLSANGSAVGVRRSMRSTNHRREWYRIVWRNNRGRGVCSERVAIPVWIVSCYSKVTLKGQMTLSFVTRLKYETIIIARNCNLNLMPRATNKLYLFSYVL